MHVVVVAFVTLIYLLSFPFSQTSHFVTSVACAKNKIRRSKYFLFCPYFSNGAKMEPHKDYVFGSSVSFPPN